MQEPHAPEGGGIFPAPSGSTTLPSVCVLGISQLQSPPPQNSQPSPRETLVSHHPSQPHPALKFSIPSVKQNRPLARRTCLQPSHQPPLSKRNSGLQNKIFCLKHYQKSGGKEKKERKTSRFSPESCHFLISETPSPGRV